MIANGWMDNGFIMNKTKIFVPMFRVVPVRHIAL